VVQGRVYVPLHNRLRNACVPVCLNSCRRLPPLDPRAIPL